MNKPNNKPGITYRLQVKDRKLIIDADNTSNFKDAADLHGWLVSALGHVLDLYDLEELIYGDISNITIVISPDDIGDDDFVTTNAG